MNPEQWLSLKWNGGSTMSDRWLNQSKIIQQYDIITGNYVFARIKVLFGENVNEIDKKIIQHH